MVFYFYNTCLNSFNFSSLFAGEIIISSTSPKLSSGTGFGFTILSAILFPMNSAVASVVLWTTFLEAVFRASSPVLVAVSNNCFQYLSERFLANDKNPYPLTYFLLLGSIEKNVISIY